MIRGERVNLRTVREKDLDELYNLSCEVEDAGEFMPVALQSQSGFKAQFQQSGFWSDDMGELVIETATGEIAGIIGFTKTAHYIDGFELFYRIFESKHRGKGLMSEALPAFIRFIFQSKNVNRLQAVTVEGNEASVAILDKMGFVFDCTMRQARHLKGKHVNLKVYAILKDEVLGGS